MHKDTVSAVLVLDDASDRIEGCRVLDTKTAPFLGNLDLKNANLWWQMRSIPSSRETIREIMHRAGCLSAGEFLAKNLALSMTDAYWLLPSETSLTYEDVKLSHFPDINVNKVPYHNEASYDPNASLGGQMEKYWDLSFDPPQLVKTASAHYGQQAWNEVFASMLHKMQNTDVPFVSYRARRNADGGALCMCPNFASDRKEFVPAYEVLHSTKLQNNINDYQGYIKICIDHGIDPKQIRKFMDYQTLTDFILSNEDRHLCNFGILRDPDTMQFLSPAPIFDTGNSMFFSDSASVPYRRAELLQRKITSFYPTEEKMLSNVKDTNVVHVELLPTKGFVIDFYIRSGIPEERAEWIGANYAVKVEMVKDLQRGIKISLYNEKQRERSAENEISLDDRDGR